MARYRYKNIRKTLVQIKRLRDLFPVLLVFITRAPRWRPDARIIGGREWTPRIFNFYEKIFGRRMYKDANDHYGVIRPEAAIYTHEGKTIRVFFTKEAALMHFECTVREVISSLPYWRPKFSRYHIFVPMLQTTAGFPIPASPFLFAIALDSNLGTTTRQSSVSSISTSFTNSAGTIVVAGTAINTTGSASITGTYNSVSMTRYVNRDGSAGESAALFFIASPATGANTLALSLGATVTADYGAMSYSGAGAPDVSTTTSSATTTVTETLTTLTDNSWMIASAGLQRNSSASTGSTIRSGLTGTGFNLFDSNAAITPTGSHSMSQTLGGTTSDSIGLAMTIVPAVAAQTGQFFFFFDEMTKA